MYSSLLYLFKKVWFLVPLLPRSVLRFPLRCDLLFSGGLPLGPISVSVSPLTVESAVPLATWSAFGMSQGLLFPLSHSGLRVPFPWWFPVGVVSPFVSSSDSFTSTVPLRHGLHFGFSLVPLGLCLIWVSGFPTGGVLLFILVPF